MEAKQKSIINLKSCLLSNCLLERCNWILQRRAFTCGTEKEWQRRDFTRGGERIMAGTRPLRWEQGCCRGRERRGPHTWLHMKTLAGGCSGTMLTAHWCGIDLRASCTRSQPFADWTKPFLHLPTSLPPVPPAGRGWQRRNEACRDQLQHPKLGKRGVCRIWRPNLLTNPPKIYGVKKYF